jgi:GxxExxY protein
MTNAIGLGEPGTLTENEIGRIVVDVALTIHRDLGPGLLESVYETVLTHELRARGLRVRRQAPVAIRYRSFVFDEGFRADLIANNKVLLELKSVKLVNNAHKKQTLTYLKLTGLKLGYLLNFGAALMKDGIIRIVNGLEDTHDSPNREERRWI